jgi:hypothetical protein
MMEYLPQHRKGGNYKNCASVVSYSHRYRYYGTHSRKAFPNPPFLRESQRDEPQGAKRRWGRRRPDRPTERIRDSSRTMNTCRTSPLVRYCASCYTRPLPGHKGQHLSSLVTPPRLAPCHPAAPPRKNFNKLIFYGDVFDSTKGYPGEGPSSRDTRVLTGQEYRASQNGQIWLGILKKQASYAVGPDLAKIQAEIAGHEKEQIPVAPAQSKNLDSPKATEKNRGSPDKTLEYTSKDEERSKEKLRLLSATRGRFAYEAHAMEAKKWKRDLHGHKHYRPTADDLLPTDDQRVLDVLAKLNILDGQSSRIVIDEERAARWQEALKDMDHELWDEEAWDAEVATKKPPRRTNDDVEREEAAAAINRHRANESMLNHEEWYNKNQKNIQTPLRPVQKYKLGTGKPMTMQNLRRRRLQRQKNKASKTTPEYPQRADYADGLDWVNAITASVIRDYVNRMLPVMNNYMTKTATAIMFQHWKLGTLPAHDTPIMGYVTFTPAGEEWYKKYNDPYFATQMEGQALGQRILKPLYDAMFQYLNTILERHITTTAFDHWRTMVPQPPPILQRPTAPKEPLLGYGYGKDPGKDLPRQAADLARFKQWLSHPLRQSDPRTIAEHNSDAFDTRMLNAHLKWLFNSLNTTATYQRTAAAFETWRHHAHMMKIITKITTTAAYQRTAAAFEKLGHQPINRATDLRPSAATTQHNRVPTQTPPDATPGQHTHKVLPQMAPQMNMKELRAPRTNRGRTKIKVQQPRSTDKGKLASRSTPLSSSGNALYSMLWLALGARLLLTMLTLILGARHPHHRLGCAIDIQRHTLLRDWREDLRITGTLFLDKNAKMLSHASNWHHARKAAPSLKLATMRLKLAHPHAMKIHSENRVRKWPKRPQIGHQMKYLQKLV